MITILVIYDGSWERTFDRNYYVEKHLPLVRETWSSLGMQSTVALFPASDEGIVAMAACTFQDEAAVKKALTAPESARIMSDIPNYTDIQPRLVVLAPFEP